MRRFGNPDSSQSLAPALHVSLTVLRTINTTWATNNTPATQVTILEDGSTQSEVDTTYDSNGLLDSVSEYDWGSGAKGNLLRITNYTYQTSTNYTNLNLIDLVISRQVKDVNGTIQYRQDVAYDATTGDNRSCPTGVLQHNDSAYGCAFYYRGNPTSVTTYLAPATQGSPLTKNFTYDFFGNLLTAQLNCCQNKTWGFSSASTTQNYSLPDSVTTGSSPSLKTTYTYYLPTGQVHTATDPNGLITNAAYDYLRRPTSVSQTSGPSVSMSYNDSSFTSTTTATIDSSKSVQQITGLDALGRPNLTTIEDASNNIYSKTSVTYDLAGRAYQTSNPYIGSTPSYWTTAAFDVLGRPTSVTLPDNSAQTLTYSTNSTTSSDPAGIQRKSSVDGVGRLSALVEPDPTQNNSLSLTTSYTYNVIDELTQIAQGSSQTRTYTYDALGRALMAATPEAGIVCFGTYSGSTCQQNGYDSFDNLLYRTDARGVVTSYTYDTLNRLTGVSYNVSGATGVPATSSLSFTFGNDSSCNSAHGAGCIGKLITMTDGVGSENYTYNSVEQLTQLQKVINNSTYTNTYTYNLSGELTQITYPSGRIVQQSVDPIGRLCEIAPSTSGCGTAASPYATGLIYSAAGQVTGLKYGNGIYASFGFSSDRLQLNCLDYSTTNRSGTCTHDSTTKFGLSYSYPASPGNNGFFSSISDSVDAGRSSSYTYDSLYRLVTAVTNGSGNYPAWGLQETFDRYGNRNVQAIKSGCTGITCPTFSATASTATNRLPSPYTYDLSGNMTYDGSNTLVYDAENHATSSTGIGTGAYVYDGDGLRVQKCLPICGGSNPNTVYIFSGAKIIAEYDSGAAVGSPSREYIYSGGALLARIDSSGARYYHQDHVSNRLVTDSSGNTLEQMGTFPFGESWYNASNDKLLFTTYERDSESGNDYAQARYNVSRLARFSSPDPIAGNTSDPQSFNRYSYVRNMPVLFTDPQGTCPPTVQNVEPDGSQSAESGRGGPSAASDEGPVPEPQWQPCGGGNPWYPFMGFGGGWEGGGGSVSIDGGESFDPGSGLFGITGFGTNGTGFGSGAPGGGGMIGVWTPGGSVTAGGVTDSFDGYWTFIPVPGDPETGADPGGPDVQAQIKRGGLVANLLLSDENCAKFLKSILTQAGWASPNLDTFRTILNSLNYVPSNEKPDYPGEVAFVRGGTDTVNVLKPGSPQLGQVFLHETFHTNAFGISDMGLALYATGSALAYPPNATKSQKDTVDNQNSQIASQAFHDNCDVTKVKP